MLLIEQDWIRRAELLANYGSWEQDCLTGKLWWSDHTFRIFGMDPKNSTVDFDEFLNMVHEEFRDAIFQSTKQLVKSDDYKYDIEYKVTNAKGELKIVHERAFAQRDRYGKTLKINGIIQDITERKMFEDERTKLLAQLEKSLDEKNTIIREMNHRIKNNLMIISNMIDFNIMDSIEDHERNVLKDIQSRITTIGSLHELLYFGEKYDMFPLQGYVHKLIEAFSKSVESLDITFELNVEDIKVHANTAIPIGMIINEFITNSVKYAFKSSGNPSIKIDISRSDCVIKLVMSDNGSGFPPGYEIKSGGFGSQIMNALVKQLKGEVSVSSADGAMVTIFFPCCES